MASGTFKLPASGSLAMPFLSPNGDSPPAFIDHDAERVTSIALQSQGATATAVFESDQQLPRINKLLPVEDLLRLSAEGLGAKMAAASPELSVYRAAFVSAGFCGAVVCSYASMTDSDFEQLLMDVGIGDTGHRQRLISELRLLRSRYAALEVPVPPVPMLQKLPPALERSRSPPSQLFPYNPVIKGEYLHISLPCLWSGSSRFVIAAWDLMRSIDGGHLASIADLAWLLLHGREELRKQRPAAFHMAREGSRRGCLHSQGVLAFCYSSWEWYESFEWSELNASSKESFAKHQRTARQLANASAEAGSKYGQFALGCILESDEDRERESERGEPKEIEDFSPDEATAPWKVLFSLAAAQGLDFGQLNTAMFKMQSDESREEALHLCYSAAGQGLIDAFEYLAHYSRDWDEAVYWERRVVAADHSYAKRNPKDFYARRAEEHFLAEYKDMDCKSAGSKLAAAASVGMKEIADRNLKLFSDRELAQQSHYAATERQVAACKFFSLASKLKRAAAGGHLASVADLAWLLLHGREGIPENKAAAFNAAQEASRLGCPHSQGVLALCVLMGCNPSSPAPSAANELTARQLANASAKAGSKYGQFALGCILWNETPQSYSAATPYGAQFALAAAQGLDEAQVNWSMMLWKDANDAIFAAELEREEDKDDKARGLLLLAAAQGCYNAYSPLFDFALDDEEANYWRERQDSFENARLYSVGPPQSSAALAALIKSKARLNADAAASQAPSVERQQLNSDEQQQLSGSVLKMAGAALEVPSLPMLQKLSPPSSTFH